MDIIQNGVMVKAAAKKKFHTLIFKALCLVDVGIRTTTHVAVVKTSKWMRVQYCWDHHEACCPS